MVVFSADTDMPTVGWTSLTSTSRAEVVITTSSDEEDSNPASLEARVNAALGRTDLRVVQMSRVIDNDDDLRGLSFSEWSRRYKPPTLIYKDIMGDGEAVEVADADIEREKAEPWHTRDSRCHCFLTSRWNGRVKKRPLCSILKTSLETTHGMSRRSYCTHRGGGYGSQGEAG
jgi:hypothetical protein